MRTEASSSPASPLTVWVGSMTYVFHPGRDVIVGYGARCDIRLDHLRNVAAGSQTTQPDLVLRYHSGQWVAIDWSTNGIFVDGARRSTVEIRDGQAITLGDPHRGPRLIFHVGRSVGPPVRQPHRRHPYVPTERTTQQLPTAPPQRPTVERAVPSVSLRPTTTPPARPSPPATPPVAPPAQSPAAEQQQPPGRGLIERMTDATRKLRLTRPAAQPEGANSTYRLPLQPGARTVGVAAYQLGLTIDTHVVLTDVSFKAPPGTLTAVIGPSAARNSVLLDLLGGTRELSSGVITVDDHDVHAERESMRTRIGIVTGDDRVHRRLTVAQALRYAAQLRLPPDAAAGQPRRVVNQVLDELELTPHRATRIGKLSPEVRRCASMAIELITRPTLLVVADPAVGLDATQENHVMAMLRRQADLGCVVVVALTSRTSLTHLNICDQVLLLTPAGALAFAGPPLRIESAMGSADWSVVFEQVSADPDGAHRAFLTRQRTSAPPAPPTVAEPGPPPAEPAVKRQIRLVARRQARLLVADRVYFAFLAVLPFVLAALTLLLPGNSGLDRADPNGPNPHEAIEILAALNVAAVIMGTALTIRDLVSERHVFRRERAVGLSTAAYLIGKVIVFGVAAAIQAAILTTIVIRGKGGPVHDAVVLHNADVELWVTVAATGIVSAIVGLALSALGNRLREVLPLLVPVILASLLFNGSLVAVVDKWGFQQISWFIPAQWGFAASASTVDLRRVDPVAANAQMWTHYSGWWVFDMIMLVVCGALAAGFVLYRLRGHHLTAATSTPIK